MKKCMAFVLALVLFSQCGWAQSQTESRSDWAAVTAIKIGAPLRVDLRNGTSLEGRFDNASPDNLSIAQYRKKTDVRRADVARLYQTRGAIGKSMAFGGLIGAGSGATAGYLGGSSCDRGCWFSKGEMAAGGAIVGAGFGAIVGLVVGLARHKKVAVYEVK